MKPNFDPDIHEDSPSLTAEFLKGMRPTREVHGHEWANRDMGRERGCPNLEAPDER